MRPGSYYQTHQFHFRNKTAGSKPIRMVRISCTAEPAEFLGQNKNIPNILNNWYKEKLLIAVTLLNYY